MRHTSAWTLLIVVAALGFTVGPALAWTGTGGEPTFLEWWQSRFGVSSNPNSYDLNGDFPNAPYSWGATGDETALSGLSAYSWFDGWSGYTYLQIEYSGWDAHSDFGIYDVSDSGEGEPDGYAAYTGSGNNAPAQTDLARSNAGLVKIFDASKLPGSYYPGPPNPTAPTWGPSNTFVVPKGEFGFWFDCRANSPNVNQGIWFTNPLLNDAVDDNNAEPDNDVGSGTAFTPYQQCRVFQHPEYAPGWGWILAWEDWDASQIEYQNQPRTEVDYQDLIVSFVRLDDSYTAHPPTPEASTWLLLLATGAVGGWIRRRRND